MRRSIVYGSRLRFTIRVHGCRASEVENLAMEPSWRLKCNYLYACRSMGSEFRINFNV